MSLTGILNTAQSGLAAAQTQMQVMSENVTNVDTPGYIREIANQVSTATGGVGTGVDISSIQLATNNFLQTAAQQANAAAGSADALAAVLDQVQQLFGDPAPRPPDHSSSRFLLHHLAGLRLLLVAGAEPDLDAAISRQSISDVQQVFSQASGIYSGIQQARGQADTQISSDVTQVNGMLQQIESLNHRSSAATPPARTPRPSRTVSSSWSRSCPA